MKDIKLLLDPFTYRKIEKVAAAENMAIEEACIFLASKVITPETPFSAPLGDNTSPST